MYNMHVVPIMQNYSPTPQYANYLPDELLLYILECIPEDPRSQGTIARFCLVNRYIRFLSPPSFQITARKRVKPEQSGI